MMILLIVGGVAGGASAAGRASRLSEEDCARRTSLFSTVPLSEQHD